MAAGASEGRHAPWFLRWSGFGLAVIGALALDLILREAGWVRFQGYASLSPGSVAFFIYCRWFVIQRGRW